MTTVDKCRIEGCGREREELAPMKGLRTWNKEFCGPCQRAFHEGWETVRGRPIVEEPANGTTSLRVPLAPEELELIDRVAQQDRRKRGAWCRHQLVLAARKATI